jgi:hypothetical protein
MQAAELWIRLSDGRTLRERYNQMEMAQFIREAMMGRLSRGSPLYCFDGEYVEIPADQVVGIELLDARVPEDSYSLDPAPIGER